jgi:hypothetical protein
MATITTFESIDSSGATVTNVCIDDGNGNFLWMSQATYDAQQSSQANPAPTAQ